MERTSAATRGQLDPLPVGHKQTSENLPERYGKTHMAVTIKAIADQ